MTQLTINIEDKSILPHLKKIFSAIASTKKKKCGLEEALEDVEEGRVFHVKSVDKIK